MWPKILTGHNITGNMENSSLPSPINKFVLKPDVKYENNEFNFGSGLMMMVNGFCYSIWPKGTFLTEFNAN